MLANRRSASRQALALLDNLAVWLQQWRAASDVAKGHCHTRGAVAYAAEHGVRRARPRGTPDLDAVPARSGAAGRGSPLMPALPFRRRAIAAPARIGGRGGARPRAR